MSPSRRLLFQTAFAQEKSTSFELLILSISEAAYACCERGPCPTAKRSVSCLNESSLAPAATMSSAIMIDAGEIITLPSPP